MVRLLLVRQYLDKQTLGRFFVFKGVKDKPIFECAALELPDINNERNISCIPEGKYPCEKITSPTFGKVIAVNDVPERGLIRIHYGNFLSDIRGCILPGRRHTFIDSDDLYDVDYSKATTHDLLMHLPSKFDMKIVSL